MKYLLVGLLLFTYNAYGIFKFNLGASYLYKQTSGIKNEVNLETGINLYNNYIDNELTTHYSFTKEKGDVENIIQVKNIMLVKINNYVKGVGYSEYIKDDTLNINYRFNVGTGVELGLFDYKIIKSLSATFLPSTSIARYHMSKDIDIRYLYQVGTRFNFITAKLIEFNMINTYRPALGGDKYYKVILDNKISFLLSDRINLFVHDVFTYDKTLKNFDYAIYNTVVFGFEIDIRKRKNE
jgi:hypothetical protein